LVGQELAEELAARRAKIGVDRSGMVVVGAGAARAVRERVSVSKSNIKLLMVTMDGWSQILNDVDV
jgi:hypothetical protein